MKITDLQIYVVHSAQHDPASPAERPWTFVRIDTDAGLAGWGEATNYAGGGSLLSAHTLALLREVLVGEDPADIEMLWHKMYRHYTYLGGRGLPTTAISGVDIALWDLKGKAVGRPVYDLLGGKVRESVSLYANGWFVGCRTPAEFAAAAVQAVADGHQALKLDPFLEMIPYHTAYLSGQLSAAGEEEGCAIVAAIRQAVGPQIEILIDAHGNYNVPTAVRLANRLYEESRIEWFEEPVPPESFDALRTVRQQVQARLCVGERLFTRWDFLPVFQEGLADYVMPDVVWTGGISEIKKIATMAEAYYVPISPHNAMGALQVVAGAHAMMSVPNFYRLEYSTMAIPAYNAVLTEDIDFRAGDLYLSDRPGLGVELDLDYLEANLHPAWRN